MEEDGPSETEHDRHAKYRKLRTEGKSDLQAREEVWPSTSVGMRRNEEKKAELAKKAEGEEASSEQA